MYQIKAKPAGFFKDLMTITLRAVKGMLRETEYLIPSIIIPVFFFGVNTGSLESIGSYVGESDFKAFQLPVAIVFAVTGISRATALVTDIQTGYFDKLLTSPVNRWSLLIGLMSADFILVFALSSLVVLFGLFLGVNFVTGILGVFVFLLFSALWGLAFTGFSYAIALKTGNPGAVSASFIIFFPFTFLTTSYVPLEFLSGWLKTVALYNPVTYLLDGLRALITKGWVGEELIQMTLAILLIGVISFVLAFWSLSERINQK